MTFYYDDDRNIRTGTTYFLNTDNNDAGWDTDGTKANVTRVVFDPSFADARPTTTYGWFYGMTNLQSVEGLEHLNTSKVTRMDYMFYDCYRLTNLDLSHFNTATVDNMEYMFNACTNLRTIYDSIGWSTAAVTGSLNMFYNCTNLVGGQGTTFDSGQVDANYAHIDGGPDNPGYFTRRGDVNGDGVVNISDVTDLVNYLLTNDANGINLNTADCNQDSVVNVSDATALINYLLNNTRD